MLNLYNQAVNQPAIHSTKLIKAIFIIILKKENKMHSLLFNILKYASYGPKNSGTRIFVKVAKDKYLTPSIKQSVNIY